MLTVEIAGSRRLNPRIQDEVARVFPRDNYRNPLLPNGLNILVFCATHMMYVNRSDLRRATVSFAAMPVLLASLVPVFAQSQGTPPSTPAAIPIPAVITEMECTGSQCVPDAKVSGSWKFSGILGTADWNNGAEARVVFERFDGGRGNSPH